MLGTWEQILPPGEGRVVPGGLPIEHRHRIIKKWLGWGFVSPRHLGHWFLRNKSKTFLFPGVAGTTWWLPWTKLELLKEGSGDIQKPVPGPVWALGFPFSLRDRIKKVVHPRHPRTMAFRVQVPGGTVAWPGVGPSPSRARGTSLPGATGARPRGGEGLGPGAGCRRWGPGGRPRSGGGHSPSGGTVSSVSSG